MCCIHRAGPAMSLDIFMIFVTVINIKMALRKMGIPYDNSKLNISLEFKFLVSQSRSTT